MNLQRVVREAGTNQQFMNNISVHKLQDERVSIGLDMLKYAGECIVIATGCGKKDALEKLKTCVLLPVAMVEPDVWFRYKKLQVM